MCAGSDKPISHAYDAYDKRGNLIEKLHKVNK